MHSQPYASHGASILRSRRAALARACCARPVSPTSAACEPSSVHVAASSVSPSAPTSRRSLVQIERASSLITLPSAVGSSCASPGLSAWIISRASKRHASRSCGSAVVAARAAARRATATHTLPEWSPLVSHTTLACSSGGSSAASVSTRTRSRRAACDGGCVSVWAVRRCAAARVSSMPASPTRPVAIEPSAARIASSAAPTRAGAQLAHRASADA